MDKYLLEILKSQKTIIIPGLGALTLTNESTGEVMFMPYLKYDDGSLSKFISEQDNISENDAKNLIAKYVREVEAKINSGSTYDMYRFGSFRKNSDGDIEFIQWEESSNLEDRQEEIIEPVITQNAVVDKEEEIEEIVSEEPAILPVPEEIPEIKKEKKETHIKDEIKPEISQVIPANEGNTIESNSPEVYSEEEQWKDDLDLPPINAKKEIPKKPILEKTKKDKKRKGPLFYTLLVLGVLIVCGTLVVAVFYQSFEKLFSNQVHKSDKIEQPKEVKKADETAYTADTIVQETAIEPVEEPNEPEPIQEETVQPEQLASSDGNMIKTSTGEVDKNKPYHVIGGAFSEMSNAERYKQKLADAGNKSVIIGRFDNLYIVSIDSYSSKEEAQQALSSSRSVSSNAWIFVWP